MLEPLLEAWQRSAHLHDLRSGASERDLAAAEADLGRSLPESVRALYRVTNGAALLDGNLNIDPLRGETPALVGGSDWLRSVEWTIPEELVVFGNNGSGDSFGVWLARRSSSDGPVIQIAEVGDGYAVAGTGLVPFLTWWTAYYLLLLEAGRDALRALGVPERLWRANPDDELVGELSRWADPGLPDPVPDPYERPLEVETLRAHFGSR
jgi:SMI1 / KNR4 family (SUKH-1)